MDKIRRIAADMRIQLDCSDAYAVQNKPNGELLPSVWEIQNSHMRDLLDELEKELSLLN